MEKRTTFSTSFLLRSSKESNKEALIYCRITVDTQRSEFSIKRKVRRELWINGQAKGQFRRRSLRQCLSQAGRVSNISTLPRKVGRAETSDGRVLRNLYLGLSENEEQTLLNLIEYHNTKLKHTVEWGTLKNYFTTQRYVKEFLRDRLRRSDIYLSELKYKFIVDFDYFLRKYEPLDHHKPMGNNTVMKHIERLKKMINVAVKMEWLNRDPFALHQQKFEKFERGFLTKEELELIEKKNLSLPRLEWVRDLFVFSCYTGLAYIDAMRLDPASISVDFDKEYWLITNRQKTNISVKVPLLPAALKVVEKYKKHPSVYLMVHCCQIFQIKK